MANFIIPNIWPQAMREAASSKAKPLTVENVAGAFLVVPQINPSVKLGPRRNYHKGRAAIGHFANQ